MHTKTRFTLLVACMAAFSLLFSGMAFADWAVNDVGSSGVETIESGSSTTIAYSITARNGDGFNGCNATAASPITVGINLPSMNRVTARNASNQQVSSLTFTNCTSSQNVTFSSNHVGDWAINHSVSGGVAGGTNENRANFTLKVTAPADTTPPVITKTITGTQGSNGWYTSNVTVAWTVTDNESTASIVSGCGTQTFSTETASVTSSCSASSAGGTSSDSVTLKIDKTAPTGVALAPSGTAGQNGWYTSDVTVSTSGSDALSGVTCTTLQSFTNETAGATVNGSCTNGAGLTTAASPLTVKIDKSGPSASLAVTNGSLGSNSWYTSNVTVGASGSDSISGPVSCSPSSVSLTSNTAGTAVNSTCTNQAGLSTAASPLTVKIDKSNPSASLSVHEGTLGDGGWYTNDVTVRTSGADDDSGIDNCTADQHLTEDTSSAGREFNGSCTNNAGLRQNADPLTVKRDASAPSAALVVTEGTAGANGWYTSNVKVEVQGADAQSDVTCSDATTLTSETTGTQVTGYCTNGAGARTNATPMTIKIDKTGPSAELAATGQSGSNGWFTDDVTITTSGSDTVSAGVTCTATQSQTAETAGREFNGSCTNAAGLTTNATPITVKLDKTGPSASAAITNSPQEGSNGWYTSDIAAATTGSDSISAPVTCTKASVSQTDETTGVNLAGVCTNDAGLSTAAAALNVKLDKTPPAVTVTPSGQQGDNGWYTGNVTIATGGTDAISGVASCTENQSQTADTAGADFYGSCTNGAGLTSTNAQVTVKRDATAPTNVAVLGFTDGAAYWPHETLPTVTCATPSDTTSGIASQTGPTQNPTGTFTCSAKDNAGNPASNSKSYTLRNYDWKGFKSPVDGGAVLNRAKAGSAIPVKFSLNGDMTLGIFAAGSPSSAVTTCDPNATVDAVEQTVTAGSSSLSYDSVTDTYNYVWKTDTKWASSCRQLVLTLKDGLKYRANFQFTK